MTNFLSEQWIDAIFDAKQVKDGGIVRRKVSSVDSYASEAQLVEAAKSRHFHMIRSGPQYVILCQSGEFRVLC